MSDGRIIALLNNNGELRRMLDHGVTNALAWRETKRKDAGLVKSADSKVDYGRCDPYPSCLILFLPPCHHDTCICFCA